jgi:hypothetical protein
VRKQKKTGRDRGLDFLYLQSGKGGSGAATPAECTDKYKKPQLCCGFFVLEQAPSLLEGM